MDDWEPEIRRDPVTGIWSMLATARSQRPHTAGDEGDDEACPFCPGNESLTPPEVWALGRKSGLANTPGWEIRVIPNLYPALKPDLPGKGWRRGNRVGRPAKGYHEVIIHSPHHDLTLAQMRLPQALELMRTYRARYSELASYPQVLQVMIILNQGRQAGASIGHPHTQLFALPLVPRMIRDELRNTRQGWPRSCPLCEDIAEAREDGRLVTENRSWAVFVPYASRFPYQTRLVPLTHEPGIDASTDAELEDLAEILPSVLRGIHRVLDDPPFNLFIHCAPCDGVDYQHYHWRIEIIPRGERGAGFELSTGIYINITAPEEAAEKLREATRET